MRYRAELFNKSIVIESDSDVGWYIYVYDGQRCVQDYMQDSLESAKLFIQEKLGFSGLEWREYE